jgi:hypothetical protein
LDPKSIGAEIDDQDDIPFLRFSPEAQNIFNEWREPLERRLRTQREHPVIEAHLAKFRSLIPSLALLIHLADDKRGPVGEDALRMAIGWGEYLEAHARRIYSLALQPAALPAAVLAQRLRQGDLADGFALRDVYRQHWSGLATHDDAGQAVNLLADLGWLRAEQQGTPGRTRTVYRINPLIYEAGGADGSAKSDKSPPSGTFVTSADPPPPLSDQQPMPGQAPTEGSSPTQSPPPVREPSP